MSRAFSPTPCYSHTLNACCGTIDWCHSCITIKPYGVVVTLSFHIGRHNLRTDMIASSPHVKTLGVRRGTRLCTFSFTYLFVATDPQQREQPHVRHWYARLVLLLAF